MHTCLRDNFQKLTDSCRKEELKLNIIQSRDVRLRPKLNKACSEEIAVYCKDVEKGEMPALLLPKVQRSPLHMAAYIIQPSARRSGAA